MAIAMAAAAAMAIAMATAATIALAADIPAVMATTIAIVMAPRYFGLSFSIRGSHQHQHSS
jgi:hypothetical protein